MADAYSPFDIVGDPNTGGFSPLRTSTLDDLLKGFGGPLGIGSDVLSKLFSYLGGGGQRKRKKEIYNSLGALAGQVGALKGRLNPTNLTAIARASAQPDIRKFGGELDKRYGFDSGRAGGEFASNISELLAKLYPQFAQQSANFDLDALMRQAQIKQSQGSFI